MAGSVLETFFFMFESDANNVKKGLNEGKNMAGELETDLLSTDKVAGKLGENLLSIAKNAATAAIGFLALSGLKGLTTDVAETNNELGDTARKARVNVETLSAMRSQLLASGRDAGALAGELEGLADKFRSPEKALGLIANRMRGMSQIQAIKFGEQFGLGQDTVTLLMKGKQGLDDIIARNKELGVVTQEQIEVAQKYRTQSALTNQVWDDMRRTIGTLLLPAFTWALEAMQKFGMWIRDNRQFVVAFFGAVAGVITVVYLPALVRAIAATYALLAPYLAVIAVVAAVGAVFALVVDDVLAFLAGNKSVIGELSKKWPIIGEVVKDVAQVFKGFWEYLKAFVQFFKDVFDVGTEQAFRNLGKNASKIVDLIGERFPLIKEYASKVVEAVEWLSNATGVSFDDISTAVSLFVDGLKSMLHFVVQLITEGPAAAFKDLGTNVSNIVEVMARKFPTVGGFVKEAATAMVNAARWAGDAWEGLLKIIGKVVDFVVMAVNKVKGAVQTIGEKAGLIDSPVETQPNLPGAGPTGDIPIIDPRDAITLGKQQLQDANSNPMAATSSSAISNSQNSKSTSVTTGDITIQTQATDSEGIAKSVGTSLGEQMRQASDQFDDGVAA